uniref:Uncharacterized protein n=1 Tax=Cucumis melo TaxID=3656 RepID=A0A9I9E182_CUCME
MATPNIHSQLNFQITQQTHFNNPPFLDNTSFNNNSLKKEHRQLQNNNDDNNNNIPPWLTFPINNNSTSNDHNHHQIINPNHNNRINLGPTSLHLIQSASPSSPHMSATALLQKAAQMGSTMSSNSNNNNNNNNNNNAEPPHTIIPHTNCNFGLNLSSTTTTTTTSSSSRDIHQNHILEEAAAGLSHALPFYRNKIANFEGAGDSFELDQFGGVFKKNNDHHHHQAAAAGLSTRDFLGLRAISHTEFLSNIAAAGNFSHCINNTHNVGAAQNPQTTQIQNQST